MALDLDRARNVGLSKINNKVLCPAELEAISLEISLNPPRVAEARE